MVKRQFYCHFCMIQFCLILQNFKEYVKCLLTTRNSFRILTHLSIQIINITIINSSFDLKASKSHRTNFTLQNFSACRIITNRKMEQMMPFNPYWDIRNEYGWEVVYQEYYNYRIIEMKDDISCVFEGIDNNGAIYVSGIHAAQNIHLLRDRNITAILTVARGAKLTHPPQQIPHYLYIPADDKQSFELSKYFDSAFLFIEKARRQTNILIHCMAGISRSATIAGAYLIIKFGYEMNTVVNLLQRKRKQINPNPGFIRQLQSIKGKSRPVEKSVQNRLESNKSTTFWSAKKISTTAKKGKQQNDFISSKYLPSYDSNRTPMRIKKENQLEQKNSSKRNSIQLKIDRVKKTLFNKMIPSPQSQGIENCQSFVIQ